MIHWQRMWDDDGNTGRYHPFKIIALILSHFYLFAVNFRNWLYDHRILKSVKLSRPVISVGNITVGGTGKTPCVMMLAQMLQKNGYKPAVISRGYGGRHQGRVQVVSDGANVLLDSEAAGDEPFLMARKLRGIPVITGAKRKMTGAVAIDQFGANVLICDDAMQHRQIYRDMDLILFDSRDLNKDQHVLPLGKLREPIAQLKRADAVILTRTDEAKQTDSKIEKLLIAENIPVFRSIHHPQDIMSADESVQQPVSVLNGKKVFAFCGIGHPGSFEKTLLSTGAQILSFVVFPDHHRFREKELKKLKTDFIQSGADYLVTTEKDAARIQVSSDLLKDLFILQIAMKMQPSERLLENFMIGKLKSCQVNPRGK